jgi:hypothetical protein
MLLNIHIKSLFEMILSDRILLLLLLFLHIEDEMGRACSTNGGEEECI